MYMYIDVYVCETKSWWALLTLALSSGLRRVSEKFSSSYI